MSITSLLLNRPLSPGSIALGRLVLDPKCPDEDFWQPSFHTSSNKSSNDTDSVPASFVPDIAVERLKDFHEILRRARGTKLELSLLDLFSVAPSAPARSSTVSVASSSCVSYRLRNPSAYLSAACQQTDVRNWLENESQRPWSTVYLICGFMTLTDTRVELGRHHENDVSAAASVDAAMLVGAPIPAPVGGLSIGGKLSLTSKRDEEAGYTAVGEQVFAVQCRKVRFSWFSTKKVDRAYLEKSSRWKSYISTRAGQEEEGVDDGITAEVAESLAPSDLIGDYSSFQLDGLEMIYRND